jgi:hypothetical protein
MLRTPEYGLVIIRTNAALRSSALRGQLHVPHAGGLRDLVVNAGDILPVGCRRNVDFEVADLVVEAGCVDIILGAQFVRAGFGASDVFVRLQEAIAEEVGCCFKNRPVVGLWFRLV